MTLFVVTLLTILVMELVDNSQLDLRISRSFSERIQSDYILKSLMNYGRVLIAMPKLEDETGVPLAADSQGDVWAQAQNGVEALAFPGEPETRLQIVDEDSKININAIAADDNDHVWKGALKEIFLQQGFSREEFPEEEARTIGNLSYDAEDQVAVIRDWIDPDDESYSALTFSGEGIESASNGELFYNRPLKTLSELLLVPGMTLERIYNIAPYVKVKASASQDLLNINTVSPVTLAALQLDTVIVEQILELRPITQSYLATYRATLPISLNRILRVESTEFTIYARVVMPNGTRWLRANVTPQGSVQNRQGTDIVELSFY